MGNADLFEFYLITILDLNITPALVSIYLFYHSCLFKILMCFILVYLPLMTKETSII